jgi:hypothetical protein
MERGVLSETVIFESTGERLFAFRRSPIVEREPPIGRVRF